DVYGHPAYVPGAQLALARVEPGAHLEAEARDLVRDARCAADRARRAIEGGEESVAHRLDLPPSVAVDLVAHELVVAVEQLPPATIAHPGRALCRPDDVGEQHGRQHSFRRRGGADAGEELLDLVEPCVDVTGGVGVVPPR